MPRLQLRRLRQACRIVAERAFRAVQRRQQRNVRQAVGTRRGPCRLVQCRVQINQTGVDFEQQTVALTIVRTRSLQPYRVCLDLHPLQNGKSA